MNIPQSPEARNIFRPAQFEAAHPNIFDREGRLDNWLRYREVNGLIATGAVFKKGKLMFIDAEKFVLWMLEEGETGSLAQTKSEEIKDGQLCPTIC